MNDKDRRRIDQRLAIRPQPDDLLRSWDYYKEDVQVLMDAVRDMPRLRAVVEAARAVNWKQIMEIWAKNSTECFSELTTAQRILVLNRLVALERAIAKLKEKKDEKVD
jgi:hypothetical protein